MVVQLLLRHLNTHTERMELAMRSNRVVLALSLLPILSQAGSVSGQTLTNKQFANRDSGEIIGIISSVQITSSTQYGEQGTVILKVEQVIAGTNAPTTIPLQYTREFAPIYEPTAWDLLFPSKRSLKEAIGARVLAFVINTGGMFSLYPANNSVQAISAGTVLGTLKIMRSRIGIPFIYDWNAGLTINVSETIYGWAQNNSITLPIDLHSLGQLINDEWCEKHQDELVLVDFENGTITNIEIVDSTILDQLKTIDSQ